MVQTLTPGWHLIAQPADQLCTQSTGHSAARAVLGEVCTCFVSSVNQLVRAVSPATKKRKR